MKDKEHRAHFHLRFSVVVISQSLVTVDLDSLWPLLGQTFVEVFEPTIESPVYTSSQVTINPAPQTLSLAAQFEPSAQNTNFKASFATAEVPSLLHEGDSSRTLWSYRDQDQPEVSMRLFATVAGLKRSSAPTASKT
ncbi:hypothetical protein PoB_007056900 [Plakobranchus ocellatus]|uniref:Uncharacterized protein n=1 Tax=Plakobranchus ocellatus TaxID=259542 RepID=A0AAV4DIP9_9GAST|nr:hypothetical protein PoB_007056900 [Plakobranchus ocellatus]